MKRYLTTLIAASVVLVPSCDRDILDPYDSTDFEYGTGIEHDMIMLGDRLENPYTVDNVSAALASVYPTKARVEVETTNLYVRFLPANDDELELLSGLDLTDHPLDYAIAKANTNYGKMIGIIV